MLSAFEDGQKKFLIASGLFSNVATAAIGYPHNEQLSLHAVIYFYFMAEELIKAAKAGRAQLDTLALVSLFTQMSHIRTRVCMHSAYNSYCLHCCSIVIIVSFTRVQLSC